MTIFRRVLVNSALLSTTEVLNKGLPFIIIILIIRYLGIESNGQFAGAMALAGLLAIFSDIGLATFLIRDVARDRKKAQQYVSVIFSLKILLAFLVLAIGAIVIYLTKDLAVFFVYTFALVYVLLDGLNVNTFQSTLRAIEKVNLEAISKLVRGVTLFAGGLVGVFIFENIYAVLIGYISSAVIQMLLNLILLYRNDVRVGLVFEPKEWRLFLASSRIFFMSHVIFIVYYSIDMTMLSYMKGDVETGLYSAAYVFFAGVYALGNVFNSVVFPFFSKIIIESRAGWLQLYRRVSGLTFLASVVGAVVLFFAAPYILPYIVKDADVTRAVSSLQILVFGLVFSFQNTILSALFNSSHNERKVILPVFIGMLMNVVLNFVAIPRYGLYGAAAVTVATEAAIFAVLFVIYWFSVRKQQGTTG